MAAERQAEMRRETKETNIHLRLNLDRADAPDIETGVGFFDHMLTALGTHGRCGLHVRATGDLEVDQHHLVEDVGIVLGQALEQQVLLIKVAWAGRSLGEDFRPPGASGETGTAYAAMSEHLIEVLANLSSGFPEYDGEGYELAGFVWFQGWTDRTRQEWVDEYGENLAQLIRDLRRDLGAPGLPFLIGETGQGGAAEEHPRALKLRQQQAAVARDPEFRETVRFVATQDFWQTEPRFDSSYHWFGNAENVFHIGDAFGRAMVKLLEERRGSAAHPPK